MERSDIKATKSVASNLKKGRAIERLKGAQIWKMRKVIT